MNVEQSGDVNGMGRPAMNAANSEAGTETLLSVQILRAVAALSVCTVHFNAVSLMLAGRAQDPLALYPLAGGVDLFFVISGFVMVYSSEPLFGTADGPRIFLGRRLARIVPLYWVMTAFGIYAESTPFDTQSLIKSYLFIPYTAPSGGMDPLYGVGWTLNFEMFFYVIFAGATILRRDSAVSLVAGIIMVSVMTGRDIAVLPVPFRFWTDPITIEFVLGMVLALIYRLGQRIPRWLGMALCVAGALAAWHGVPSQPPSGDRWITCGIPAGLIFAGLVLQPPITPMLSPLSKLGDASYAMYLVHSLVMAAILILWPRGLHHYHKPLVLVLGMLLTIVLALAIHRWFERPLTRLIRNMSTFRQRPRTGPTWS
jgi:peptidoglycan/LPS O-acetylase OafA/YrhL